MTYTSLLLLAIVAGCYHNIDAAPQFFGGNLPGGGRTQQDIFQAGPSWAHLTQSSNSRGLSSPITYSGRFNGISEVGSNIQWHSIEPAPQFFGGVQNLPGGGRTQQAGFQAGPAWGHLTQSSNSRGLSSPITYSGGFNGINEVGTGISGNLAVQPGIGGHGTVRGQYGQQVGDHSGNIFAQHDRYLDKNLRPVGPEKNSAGVNYSHKNGASAFISGSQTNGLPARGTVGATIPIHTNENGGVSVSAQTTFGHGMKPIPQVGIEGSYKF